MKAFTDVDLRVQQWGGLKPLLRSAMKAPGMNAALVAIGRTLRGSWRIRIPVVRPESHYRLKGGGQVRLLETARCHVARALFWGRGRYETRAEQDALDCAEGLALRAATFVDVGAYSGLFALIAARANPQARVLAYEIVPEIHDLLCRNVAANGLGDRIDARLMGVGEQAGETIMPEALGSCALPSSLSTRCRFSRGARVPVQTLDQQLAGAVGPLAMKIDVEGSEVGVISGAMQTIKRLRPDIICELLLASGTAETVERMLRPLGYRFLQFTDHGLIERPKLSASNDARDWLFTVRA